MSPLGASLLALVGVAAAASITTSEPAIAAIHAAEATTLPSSPTSDVQGVAFNRFFQIWLENTVSIPRFTRVQESTADTGQPPDRTTAPLQVTQTSNG